MNLVGLTSSELEREMVCRGLPAYRGRQIYRWLYATPVENFDAMTDLPLVVREQLKSDFVLRRPNVGRRQIGSDGTIKFLFDLRDGSNVETVYIPEGERHTFCLSTQVGCPLKCSFCFSGKVRFERNLECGEIISQFMAAKNSLSISPTRSNIVFMGMGEPLLNFDAVVKSIQILTDAQGLGISPRRITLSTAGLVDEIRRFAETAPAVGIAISLHATTNKLRERIMPVNKNNPIEELIKMARDLPLPRRRRVTFEYVLLGGENDSILDAKQLVSLLQGVKAKVNLIAYNPWPSSPHRRSTKKSTENFLEVLMNSGMTVSLRRSRGDDILAACGQLANSKA